MQFGKVRHRLYSGGSVRDARLGRRRRGNGILNLERLAPSPADWSRDAAVETDIVSFRSLADSARRTAYLGLELYLWRVLFSLSSTSLATGSRSVVFISLLAGEHSFTYLSCPGSYPKLPPHVTRAETFLNRSAKQTLALHTERASRVDSHSNFPPFQNYFYVTIR